MAKVAYDGTNYHGFQIQPNADTVQERIEKALSIIYKCEIKINYAGRTDTGVHALAQYIDFFSPFDTIPMKNLQAALNSILPKDIRIMDVSSVNETFHSRYSAVYRDYVYFIYNSSKPNPFYYKYSWQISGLLDVALMKQVKHIFEGKKDYSFISNENSSKNCVRRVYFLHIKQFRGFLIFHIRSNGFLRGMVRNIVGSLVAFSTNSLKIDTFNNIIQEQAEVKSHKAPPNGLFLTKVYYKKG